ncbi:MAG: hypothetical protein O2983_09295, partial [Planctomycetota bacterium]|nr:hypothetical protein [Planctomycetota bacterium]
MSDPQLNAGGSEIPQLGRRELLAMSTTFGASFLATQGRISRAEAAEQDKVIRKAAEPTGKRYDMKKSINLWAFPYPDKMTLKDCFELAADAGFDGVEVNYNLEGDISPEASEADLKAIGN